MRVVEIGSGEKIRFRFDGVGYTARSGDTVASALLAAGVRIVARSFKYHRPRGVLTAGSEEPNALITVGRGAGAEPNVRATVQEVYDGLEVFSQSSWPSLRFDAMAINDLAAPFLGAGFYYKTFMWPRAFWEKVYEPVIRRAAGLGRLSGKHNPDTYDRAFAFCDLLVVGSGPSGLMAARVAADAGLDVIVCDEDSRMGGRMLAEVEDVGGIPAADWAAREVARLATMPNVRLMKRTTVTGAYDGGVFGALERVTHHVPRSAAPLECFWRITARRTVLAAGALERPIAFENNDRLGIMMAGAVRAYLNRWGIAAGKSVAVFGNNDDAHRTARDLHAAGVKVAALIDSRADAAVGDVPYPVHLGAQVCGSSGRGALRSVRVRNASGEITIAADCLAMSGGWNPTVHLTCHMNGRPEWREEIAAFVPVTGMIPNLEAAGACNGAFSTAACLAQGAAAAGRVIEALGGEAAVELPAAEDAPYRIAPLWAVAGKGRAWLDFQNDVSVKDVKQAAAENFRSVEHMKRYTTQGMATDQGKNSNVAALAVLADATGRGIPETGVTTFRPPYSPVAIAAMGAGAQGKGFAPQRFTTSQKRSVEMGAPMIEAGLWYRPSYFPREGETIWRHSCDREVGYVRRTVGVCDVSTLGKIDIQGPDAGNLLDFVYTGMFSTLKEGRVRYGLMLREDGTVMDDGTCARMGAEHFVMTTTTAAAGDVMRHLEFVTQMLHPEWVVAFTSVTEHWAQFAVAGPKSRELLNGLLDAPVDNQSWPFMACGEIGVMGVAGRLFRISFSGEHAYEVAVPARFGAGLFAELVARAEALGGGAYGMEALNVLRIEKGHITHSEIHGRVTAFDVGMARMISPKKDCVGKVLAGREGLVDPARPRLVGLRPVGAVQQLSAGAHIFNTDAAHVHAQDQGYVTSVCFSPDVGTMIGLGFVKNGPERMGERVVVRDHMRDLTVEVEICSPLFVDPEGGRVRG
ncbi:sarcosine oxidase subunit alpha family protein [Sulfitobacter guttiformis]|uniref:Sarcosine oxidase subunit alpha n=1 Tax=Sulfitobacter guttiformis TaxID=74349 RepID=A0A420DNK2_9RHOB|nr:sarcosine oxidase subunit alpha family protein [Sulfitobacter guttiformis]KIN73175.1 Sarcosine oxidase, alpha subunit family [Sulfitobacter guttiformis KCTC 32187]RKE95856.1 sarcosine oxidase subunit alpha [Sulfitobacter guttiformis]